MADLGLYDKNNVALDTSQAGKTLSDKRWFHRLEELKQFVEKHGRTPYYSDDDSRSLYYWWDGQRDAFYKGTMSSLRREAFSVMAPFMQRAGTKERDELWQKRMNDLLSFYREHGRMPRISDDRQLAAWLASAKFGFFNHQMTEFRHGLFEQYVLPLIPTEQKLDEQWQAQYDELIAFVQKYRHPPRRGDALDRFYRKNSNLYRAGRLQDWQNDCMKRLFSLREATVNEHWEIILRKCVQFQKEHGRLPSINDDVFLSNWLAHQRVNARKNLLAPERLQMLQESGIPLFESRSRPYKSERATWDETFHAVLEFRALHGRLPQMKDDRRLAQWLASQRQRLKNGQMKEAQAELFRREGWDAGMRSEDAWSAQFQALVAFRNAHGKFPTKRHPLYAWLNYQRHLCECGRLQDYRIDLLRKEGVLVSWDDFYQKLHAFVQEHGCLPGQKQDAQLNVWYWAQVRRANKGILTEERKELLRDLGVPVP